MELQEKQNINNQKKLRVLVSGGGTGGHIFPAVAIAQEIQRRFPNAEFLFIGANEKMEMDKVPQAGFRIEGLNIAGFDRGSIIKNLSLPFKLISSLLKARKIIKNFKPDFAVGTGGFASAPALFIASQMGIPIFIQEQNSILGKTNQFLARRAKKVFMGYSILSSLFPMQFTGNPIRNHIITELINSKEAKEKLGLNPDKLTILSVGGSLGSKTLNDAWDRHLEEIIEKDYQLIWQTGKTYQKNKEKSFGNGTLVAEFIQDMPLVYSAADVIVSRAGAITISELAVVGKPILLVPFPFAAEDHQTKNAQTLVEKNAARMVKDSEMNPKFLPTLLEICENENLRKEMSENLKFFAKPEATKDIVDVIIDELKI